MGNEIRFAITGGIGEITAFVAEDSMPSMRQDSLAANLPPTNAAMPSPICKAISSQAAAAICERLVASEIVNANHSDCASPNIAVFILNIDSW
jgi:hypothetical protein